MRQFTGPIPVLAALFMILLLCGCVAQPPASALQSGPAKAAPASTPNATVMAPVKTVGIIGGMSWYSTQEYYRIINDEVQKELGGLHSAKILMYSEDFAEIEQLQTEGKWNELTQKMVGDARRLETGGADFIIIATNTMHKTADDVQANIHVPLLNIADATGKEVQKKGLKKVALLGTKYTMEQDFYKDRLTKNFGLTVVVPNEEERNFIHSVIYDELCQGIKKPASKERIKKIIGRMAKEDGTQGVILGCTELPLLIQQKDVDIPVFDTTMIHAVAAADMALNRT